MVGVAELKECSGPLLLLLLPLLREWSAMYNTLLRRTHMQGQYWDIDIIKKFSMVRCRIAA